jgi:hypothetical protein
MCGRLQVSGLRELNHSNSNGRRRYFNAGGNGYEEQMSFSFVIVIVQSNISALVTSFVDEQSENLCESGTATPAAKWYVECKLPVAP